MLRIPWSARPNEERSSDVQEREYCDQEDEHAVIDVRRVREVKGRKGADGGDRLEVHADAVRSAAELGVVEDEIEHLRERERHHDEVDALHADDEQPDHERRDGRSQHCRRQREPEIGRFVLGRHQAERVRADAEERRVPERDETRVPDEEVERKREDRENHDLGDELDVEPGAHERKHRQQQERGD